MNVARATKPRSGDSHKRAMVLAKVKAFCKLGRRDIEHLPETYLRRLVFEAKNTLAIMEDQLHIRYVQSHGKDNWSSQSRNRS